jgi:thioredoxin-like negative regulator of GroEL
LPFRRPSSRSSSCGFCRAIEFSDYCDHIAQLLRFNGVERFEVLQADFFAVQGRQFDVVTSFGFVELMRDARAAIERGDQGAAVSAIEACLAIDGSNADALALLGLLFLDKGATEEGLRLLEGVPKRMPDARNILMPMGEAYRLRGDCARAEAAFHQVLLWAPRDREVLVALESTYAAHGDRTRADACREAIAALAADSAGR